MASTPHTYVSVDEGADRQLSGITRSIASNDVTQMEAAVTLPYIPTYTVVAGPIPLATASSHILQLLGSTINRDLLRYIEVTQVGNAASAKQIEFELRRLDTAGTGGTSVTPNPVDPVDGATTARGMTLPSSKGTEDELLAKRAGTVLTAPTAGHERVVRFGFNDDPTTKPLTIAAGATTGLALKNIQTDTTATVLVEACFQEVFWS